LQLTIRKFSYSQFKFILARLQFWGLKNKQYNFGGPKLPKKWIWCLVWDLTKLVKTYGLVMFIWLGSKLVVVATSLVATEEILKTQGLNFSNWIATSVSVVVFSENMCWVASFSSFFPLKITFKFLCNDIKCNVKVQGCYKK